MSDLGKLRSTDFTPYLHQTFRVRLEGVDPIELELATVSEVGESHQLEDRTPFSLLFLGPISNQYLLQSIYRLEHEQLGVIDLFIVPLGPVGQRMQYEAIFT